MHPQQILIALVAAVPIVAGAQPESELGCFSQVPSLVQNEVYTYQNHGYCSEKCIKGNFRYAVLQEQSCGCTNSAPTAQYKLPGSKCTSRCAGYPTDTCGSADSYTVLNLGGIGSDDAESDSDDVITTADNTATSATATPTADQTPTSVAKEEASEATGSALTTNGIIIPNSVSPDSIPTGILTAASSTDKETTTASSTLSTATHSASSASSSSATPTPTGNAAGTLRAPVAGIFAVGLALVV